MVLFLKTGAQLVGKPWQEGFGNGSRGRLAPSSPMALCGATHAQGGGAQRACAFAPPGRPAGLDLRHQMCLFVFLDRG